MNYRTYSVGLGILLLGVGVTACTPAAAPLPPPAAPMAPDPSVETGRAGAVYAGGGFIRPAKEGLLRSSDGGASWEPLPVPEESGRSGFSQVSPSWERRNLYVASGPAGVIRSDDGGKSWRAVDGGLPAKGVGAVAVHLKRPDTLFAWLPGKGVHRTEDGGKGWQRMDDGPPVSKINALAHSTLPGSMNTGWLYAAAPEGLYIGMDCF